MSPPRNRLSAMLGIEHPVIQAPMARTTTPELAAAVSGAGGLGSLGEAGSDPDTLRERIRAVRRLTDAPFGVNLFAPLDPPPPVPGAVEDMSRLLARWRERLGLAERQPVPDVAPPPFEDQIAVVLDERPPVFSFTFGIPPAETLGDLREAGITVLGTATTVAEAGMLEDAGCDAVVAQGSEAGGHRGTFAAAFDAALIGTMALVPQVVDRVSCPVVAAGGIMDGRGIAAALTLGAEGAQLGTAFITCHESAAPPAYTSSITGSDESATTVTGAFTGRPARGLRGALFDEIERSGLEVPPYPLQQAMVGEVMRAGIERGETDVMIRLAGQGAPMARTMGAAELVATLVEEAAAARSSPGGG